MTLKDMINDFTSQDSFALVGVSRKGFIKFGNMVHNVLRKKGKQVFAIHPTATTLNKDKCYKSINDLPQKVGGLIIVIPKEKALEVVKQAHQAGINKIWLQQGSESTEAIKYCEDNELSCIHGQCILMHISPSGIHGLHHFLAKCCGRLPK